jgi:DNA-binding Lrp family transcriptional regulator
MIIILSLDGKYLAAKTRSGNMSETQTICMQTSTDCPRYKESAFVMITCEDCTESLIDALKSISEIKEIQATCGNYDVIVKIETDSADSLREVISTKIRTIDKIRATTTLISSPILVY